ncbi:MAG: hypothetical protein PHW76_00060 [Alphaproteobacteria bacterium]|nr:hypothetical protein [Alphaproteobacteria bacterium]
MDKTNIHISQRTNGTFFLIGAFFYKFSQLEFMIRQELSTALNLEQKISDIVIGSYDFSLLCKIAKELLSQKTHQRRKVSPAFSMNVYHLEKTAIELHILCG